MRAQLTAARPAESAVGANFSWVFTKESNCTKEIHTNETAHTRAESGDTEVRRAMPSGDGPRRGRPRSGRPRRGPSKRGVARRAEVSPGPRARQYTVIRKLTAR